MNLLLLVYIVEPIDLLLVQEVIIRVWHPFVVLKETSSCKLLNPWGIGLTEINVVFLLLSGILQQRIWSDMIGQLSERIVISSSEAPLNEVSLLVGVVIQH